MIQHAEALNAHLPVSPHARRGGLKAQERRVGWLFLAPALTAFALVIALPFVRALGLAFTHFDLRTPEPVFVGFDNFRALAASPEVMQSFLVTGVYVVLVTAITLVLGLAWALILNQSFPGRTALRAASLIPWVLPSTVTAFVWGWIFNSRYGVLNAALLELGAIPYPTAWLSTSAGAMAAIVITKI